MRTRTTVDGPHGNVAIADNFYNGSHHYGAPYFWKYTSGKQVISDIPIKRMMSLPSGKRVLVMNPVTNDQFTASAETGTQSMLTSSNPATTLYTVLPTVIVAYWGSGSSDDLGLWMYANSGSVLNSALANCPTYYDDWMTARPSLSTRANLAVFLYELRDLKRMFDLLPGRHFRLQDWREVVKYGNNQHLNYNFGWKPFLRDISNVIKGMHTLDERLNRFIREADTDLTRHVQNPPASGESTVEDNKYGWRVQLRYSWQLKKVSTFNLSYHSPYDYDDLRWRAIVDTLGLNLNAKNIWAVLPWSFVVDWFFNVSRLLDSTSGDWVQPWVILSQACSSWRFTCTMNVDCYYYNYPGNNYKPVGSVSCVRYKRVTGIPAATADTGALNADKIRLLASLAASLII